MTLSLCMTVLPLDKVFAPICSFDLHEKNKTKQLLIWVYVNTFFEIEKVDEYGSHLSLYSIVGDYQVVMCLNTY